MNKVIFELDAKAKSTHIRCLSNSVVVKCSENQSTTLEKLTSVMCNSRTGELALSKNDKIFDIIDIESFKRIFNNTQVSRRDRLRIILYSETMRIDCTDKQLKLIQEYHDSTHGRHLGVRGRICTE